MNFHMRYGLLGALVAAMLVAQAVNASPAQAMRYCPRGGYCSPGTCGKYQPYRRVQYVCNVANCSAANCPR
jgi:hypothetical protein